MAIYNRLIGCNIGYYRPWRGGDRALAADAAGDEPVRVRDLRQGVPARPEPAAAPARPQPPLEAPAAQRQGAPEARVRVPGEDVRPPQPVPRAGRPHRHQEALLPQARREEVEVRQVQQALRRAVRLEGARQDMRHQGVQMRLRHAILKARRRRSFPVPSLLVCCSCLSTLRRCWLTTSIGL